MIFELFRMGGLGPWLFLPAPLKPDLLKVLIDLGLQTPVLVLRHKGRLDGVSLREFRCPGLSEH